VSELTEILDELEERAARGEQLALATIIATRGSTYRRAGARLLVPATGDPIGNISGGCLEGDVARIGREVIASGQPRTVEFDLSADDDAVWGYGLGCNGAIELYVEPTAGAIESAAALRSALAGRGTVLSTVIAGERIGTRWSGTDVVAATSPHVETTEGERIFHEPILPPMRLVVCSAGHDAIPLVRQAAELGWWVVVADVRKALLNAERFPGAASFLDADPERAAELIGPDERTAVVVMSHNYLRDIAYLRSFLDAKPGPAYLGVLGPRGRTEQMLAELGRPGDIERLHAPAGLDIGAEGPEEVARAIVAEILAVTRGRSGAPLRDREGPIHSDGHVLE
jgi:xanthine/CO dehydrogenase XdhC/CoxF family maturation factor